MRVIKKNFLIVLAFIVMCMSFLFGSISLIDGKAENENNTIVTSGFYMKDGAAVKVVENSAGIRFTTYVEQKWYEDLLEQYEGYTATFHTLISNNVSDITTLVPNPNASNISDKAIDGEPIFDDNGIFTYYGVINYSKLTEEQLVVASRVKLSARAYVELSKEGSDSIIVFAQVGDTTRSMRMVANGLLINGDYDCDKKYLEAYLGTVYELENSNEYYETYDNSGVISTVGVKAGTYEAYVGTEYIGSVTLADNDNIALSNLEKVEVGEDCVLSLFATDNSVYRVPFKSVTKVINTASDLKNMVAYSTKTNETTYTNTGKATFTYDGYFVLGGNIELGSEQIACIEPYTDISLNNGVMPKKDGFAGTFDGCGYSIIGGSYADGGLFGTVSEKGVIKNVALVNLSKVSSMGVLGFTVNGTVDNVLIDVVSSSSAHNREVSIANHIFGGSFSNIIIRMPSLNLGTSYAWTEYMLGPATGHQDLNDVDPTTNNVLLISDCRNFAGVYTYPMNVGVTQETDMTKSCEELGLANNEGFNSYWDFSGDKPAFKSYSIA